MSSNEIVVTGAPEAVFDVLDDAYAYPKWVVGTRRIRSVDPEWPREGSSFRHAIGVPGAELHDSSKVLEHDRPRRLVLEVRFRPTGVALVEIGVTRTATGSTITLDERPRSGPFASLPRAITEPVLHLRNAWALRRLRSEVERRRRAEARTSV